ncbi:MAG: Na+/H+ antiporter NhaA [Phenylobacterium sp.]|nr:MAG: Na+/H+ antiporter NhaA [Phenylobacterium sp.]
MQRNQEAAGVGEPCDATLPLHVTRLRPLWSTGQASALFWPPPPSGLHPGLISLSHGAGDPIESLRGGDAVTTAAAQLRLLRPVDPARDHIRGGGDDAPGAADAVTVLIYGDYLCPYCRRLRTVLERLRRALGERMAYVFRHFPNEKAHPGAEFAAIASEAAARQGLFWEMHDALYAREPPLTHDHVLEAARSIGVDMDRFARDLEDPALLARVQDDVDDGRHNGVTATPTIFIEGQRYDGAWDFYSMLEALKKPVGARVQRTARAFAALPASGGVVLLIAAALALVCANTALAPAYQQLIGTRLGVGVETSILALNLGDWCSEGLLTVFFLLVGLEIRREMTAGAFTDRRAAMLPIVCAIGGVLAPAAVYLAINRGATAPGWSAPTSTGIAFALGVLAVLGRRVPTGLKVFVAALAVVDDILSVLTLAIFYPQDFHAVWLIGVAAIVGLMFLLNRWRIYAGWPYLAATVALWLALHAAGVNASLAGVLLAAFLPARPAPSAGPLLAQAATALSALEHAEAQARAATGQKPNLQEEPIWDWASRNLSAAAARLLSPADRVERAVSPWAAYVVLPLFAFTATGVALSIDLGSADSRRVLIGVVLGLVVGKPLGVTLAALATVKTKLAIMPEDTGPIAFLGAAMLCGVSDPVSLLMADQAFPHGDFAGIAKIGVLIGSVIAALLGAAVVALAPAAVTPAPKAAKA